MGYSSNALLMVSGNSESRKDICVPHAEHMKGRRDQSELNDVIMDGCLSGLFRRQSAACMCLRLMLTCLDEVLADGQKVWT
ncbi:hypothetical protein NPIL_674631 [Nephila pilipes]|uniref:Uncharacterized protein n=1 Tax=Nephila pilipes TaxID=299642 RepID=A0A8X6UGX8_NEPPI|nr:hypothetical protein NPIL_674631 [Nephila pilipes]